MNKDKASKDVIGHYNSLADLRAAWGLKPYSKRTANKEKLLHQREKFCDKHKCPVCGMPMAYIGGNVMACQNPSCKGKKSQKKDADGDVVPAYLPIYALLDETGAAIADTIFAED